MMKNFFKVCMAIYLVMAVSSCEKRYGDSFGTIFNDQTFYVDSTGGVFEFPKDEYYFVSQCSFNFFNRDIPDTIIDDPRTTMWIQYPIFDCEYNGVKVKIEKNKIRLDVAPNVFDAEKTPRLSLLFSGPRFPEDSTNRERYPAAGDVVIECKK